MRLNKGWHKGRRPRSVTTTSQGGPDPEAPPIDPEFNEPVGYNQIYTENFDSPVFTITSPTIQRKTWQRFFQDGNQATDAANVMQLYPGSTDNTTEGGEGIIGSLDNYVAGIRIPAGWNPPGSGAPVSVWSNSFGATAPQIYMRFRMKLASNYKHWLGSKFGYIAVGFYRAFFVALVPLGAYTTQEAAETRPVRIKAGFQGVLSSPVPGEGTTFDRYQNVGPANSDIITRNVWTTLEIQGIMNSVSSTNGTFRLWLNGTKIMEYFDIGWYGNGASNPNFYQFQWTPTHDSFDGAAWEEATFQYIDQFYVSKP